jgi:hypothetical protein
MSDTEWPLSMEPRTYALKYPYGKHADLARRILAGEEYAPPPRVRLEDADIPTSLWNGRVNYHCPARRCQYATLSRDELDLHMRFRHGPEARSSPEGFDMHV